LLSLGLACATGGAPHLVLTVDMSLSKVKRHFELHDRKWSFVSSFVNQKGEPKTFSREGTLAPEAHRALVSMLDRGEWKGFRERYFNREALAPLVTTTIGIQYDGERKSILIVGTHPPEVDRLLEPVEPILALVGQP
jgi:hypothetical protein